MKFLIDDEKNYLPNGMVPDFIARNFLAGGIVLTLITEKDELYIDHDLGDEDPDKTGYALLKFIEEQLGNQHRIPVHMDAAIPHKIICVSNNPAGRKNIEAAIASIRRLQKLQQGGGRHVT